MLVALVLRLEWARLTVLDQGPGVPAEFVARLFEPFEQARHARQRMQGCIGLGPPRAGEGARFWVELPLATE